MPKPILKYNQGSGQPVAWTAQDEKKYQALRNINSRLPAPKKPGTRGSYGNPYIIGSRG